MYMTGLKMFNPYTHMRANVQKDFNDTVHFFNLYNTLVSMFDYKNLPETLRPEFIEGLFITQGTCGITKYKGDLFTGSGGYTGEIFNGLPTEYLITVVGINEAELRGKVGEDFAVGWNNATMTPDWSLWQYSSILSEVDVSERTNLLFARFLRIPKVKTQKEKQVVLSAIKAIQEGKPDVVVSDNIREILTGENNDEGFLDLVDIKQIDKLQYLNQYRDNVVKRFFQMYGQGMQSTAKLAQQTTDELHGNDSVSMILPLQRLQYRKKFVEDVNALFGTEITVDFSEAWLESQDEMHEDDINSIDDRKESDSNEPEDLQSE